MRFLALLACAGAALTGCAQPAAYVPTQAPTHAVPTPASTAELPVGSTTPNDRVFSRPVVPAPATTAAGPAPESIWYVPSATSVAPTIPWPSEPTASNAAQLAGYELSGTEPWLTPSLAANFPAPVEPSEVPLYTPLANPIAEASPGDATLAGSNGLTTEQRHGLLGYWDETKRNVVGDLRNYYRLRTMLDLGIAVGLAAPLANTSLDEDFREWYQRDVRSRGSDDLASFWKPWGEGKIFIPAWAGLAIVGNLFDERPAFNLVGRFGDRTTRAYLVGAPPMLLMQFVLGASRPGESPHTSHWEPFSDTNSVSGHAFIGAVPFMTAASMVENPWAKGSLYALSTFTAWSRVNDDRHYLSQICLGWYMAYLATRSVNETERFERQVRFVPVVSPQMTGMSLIMAR